jgi:hypothetical protein
MISPLDVELDLEKVARRIARVIAKKHIEADPKLRKLDALGKASAITTMADRMWDQLDEEAEAAANEVAAQMQQVWAMSSAPNLHHAEGAKIAGQLRADGLPVAGIEQFDGGLRIGVAFRMPDGNVRGFSFPRDEALADPSLFARAYQEAAGDAGS